MKTINLNPIKVKLEVIFDIDQDLYAEKIAEGRELQDLLKEAIKYTSFKSDFLFRDHEEPIITAIICENEG